MLLWYLYHCNTWGHGTYGPSYFMIYFFWSWFSPKPRELLPPDNLLAWYPLISICEIMWNLHKKKKTSQAWYPKRAKYLSLETSLHTQVFLNVFGWKFFSECAVIIINHISFLPSIFCGSQVLGPVLWLTELPFVDGLTTSWAGVFS